MIIFRILLLPLTILYGTVILFRLMLYKFGILSRTSFDIPILCVGNLSVGGTGKTPHIEWILNHIDPSVHPAILSRGYKRKTTGYKLASITSGPLEIGDEPYQLKQKFPHVPLAVAENRVLGIPELLGDAPETDIVLMDDGYQHLPLKATGYILLTDFSNRYTRDWLLPSGMLREFRYGAKRADILIVTKCPQDMNEGTRIRLLKEINPSKNQTVLFSKITYGDPINLHSGESLKTFSNYDAICFSGVANPSLFFKHADKKFNITESFRFPDHHNYGVSDIENIMGAFNRIENKNKILLCTEKDAGKLKANNPSPDHLYYIPIQIQFQKNGAELLQQYLNQIIHAKSE